MRNTFSNRHTFDKELYSKLAVRPETRQKDRNPIVSDGTSPRQNTFQPAPSTKPRTRMLAKGDFSEQLKGTFALAYTSTENFKPTKRCYNKPYQDPIKPPEFIPQANFKRPGRNPITQGDVQREPDRRLKPDQVSQIFKNGAVEEFTDRSSCFGERDKGRYRDTTPDLKSYRVDSDIGVAELVQHRYAPSYKDADIVAKPNNAVIYQYGCKQYGDLKYFADSMKGKRNSSSVFYS